MHTSTDRLEQFLLGDLPAADAERVDEHLSACDACRQSLSGLQSQYDTVVIQLREPKPLDPFEDEPACRDMVSRAADYGGSAANDPSSPTLLAVGHTEMVRDYRLLKPLGSGGMGTVYQALHTKLNRVVAIKLLSPEKLTATARARFEREMQIIGQLEHPMIVRATDAGVVDGVPFLVMELVDGIDLERLLHRCGPLSVAAACTIIRQAALGLQHAFERGVIHRDLKPSNLMLGRAPQGGWQVKILDLGLALFEEPALGADELTADGQLMGTVDYMAPEQGENTHAVDIRADIYSLGATLFKLLTGSPPLADGTRTTTLKKLAALTAIVPPDVRTLRPDVPAELAILIQRLLAKSPEQRPTRPVELAELLAPFAGAMDLGTIRQDASGMPELSFVRRATRAPTLGTPRATQVSRPLQRAAAVALLTVGLLLAVLFVKFRTAEGVLVIKLETPTPIERIRVDDQHVEWSLPADQQTYRLQVKPGAVSTVIMTTRDGTEFSAAVPAEGLTVEAGKSYSLTAKFVPARTTQEPPTVAATPSSIEDRERSALEWGHALGGIVGGGNPQLGFVSIPSDGELPQGPFDLIVMDLSRRLVHNADMPRLDGLPHLTTLVLDAASIDDDGITRLATLPRLSNLYLSQTGLTDVGLRHLERFQGLQDLHLTETRITDGGLASLAAWPRLSILFLGRCSITDHSLEHIAACKGLRHLHVNGTKITRPGVERLRAALPKCRIESDYGDFQPPDP